MTAVSSSLTRGTSTTLRRSSEVRDTDSRPSEAWNHHTTVTAVCLYCVLCERDTAECVMLCFFGDNHNISARWTSNKAVNGVCARAHACLCIHACVYSCVCLIARLACGGRGRWRVDLLEKLLFKQKPWDASLGEPSIISSHTGSVRFSDFEVYISWERPARHCTENIWV